MASSAPKKRRVTAKAGDIFEFAAPDGRFGYGLAVHGEPDLYVAMFGELFAARPSVADLLESRLSFVGATMDALFYHRRWTVVYNGFPIPADIPFPNWKVQREGKLVTTSFDGRTWSPMRPDEAELLDFKTSRSPIAYQNAVEALNGLSEWQESYEQLKIDYARQRVTR